MHRALGQAAQSIPDVRMDKVEGLRGAIDNGSYFVESDKLAHKVVDEILADYPYLEAADIDAALAYAAGAANHRIIRT